MFGYLVNDIYPKHLDNKFAAKRGNSVKMSIENFYKHITMIYKQATEPVTYYLNNLSCVNTQKAKTNFILWIQWLPHNFALSMF